MLVPFWGMQLPAQLMSADEGEGLWDDGVGQQEEQAAMLAHTAMQG